MMYNIDFLVAALIILLIILYHYTSQMQIENDNHRDFLFFMVVGIVDVAFDILCTTLISLHEVTLVPFSKACLTIFYILQIMLPYSMLKYMQSLRQAKRKVFDIWIVIPILLGMLVIANVGTGWIFSFDSAGEYGTGPLYMITYIYALFYVLIIAVDSFVHYNQLGKKKFLVMWEFLLMAFVCIIMQFVTEEYLLTGFGLALGVLVLFLAINNPKEYTDHLTNLLDAQYFQEWARKQMEKGKTFHILSIDLYRMKQINQAMGNSIGDQLLRQVADRLQGICGTNPIFRVVGNRFIIGTYSLSDYDEIRKKIYTMNEQPFMVGENAIEPSLIVCGIMDAKQLKEEDMLLGYIEYMVSLVPKMETYIWIQGDESTLKGFYYNKEIESYLPTALEQNLFELNFQPVYSIEEKKFVSMETLCRLQHPKLGRVPASVFVGIAEKNGQMIQLGQQVLEKVCKFIKSNKQIMNEIRSVKINMSPAELLMPGYYEMVMSVIEHYELPYNYFQFEITETLATEYSANLHKSLEEFTDAGIDLCLDDFGSGYANLNTVLKLPFKVIKLDRSLLNGIDTDSQAARFYRSIVRIFGDLGYTVVAEGVETEKEMKLVSGFGVHQIQGFYFSRPLAEQNLVALVEKQADSQKSFGIEGVLAK